MFHAFSYDLQITLEYYPVLSGLILFSQVLSIVLSKTSFEQTKPTLEIHIMKTLCQTAKFLICNVIIHELHDRLFRKFHKVCHVRTCVYETFRQSVNSGGMAALINMKFPLYSLDIH